jgi:hypothetical protein
MANLLSVKLMTILTEDAKTDALAKKIRSLTDSNNHTLALLELAKFLNQKKYITIFNSIEAIHDAEGHMPMEIVKYRSLLGKELWDIAEKKMDKSSFAKIANAF